MAILEIKMMTKHNAISSFSARRTCRQDTRCWTRWPDNIVSSRDQNQSTDPLSLEAHPALEPVRSLHDIWLRMSAVTRISPGCHSKVFILCLGLTFACMWVKIRQSITFVCVCVLNWEKNGFSLFLNLHIFLYLLTHITSHDTYIHTGRFIRQIIDF